jgi:hypothetical protein
VYYSTTKPNRNTTKARVKENTENDGSTKGEKDISLAAQT